jgi:hypothetical protein
MRVRRDLAVLVAGGVLLAVTVFAGSAGAGLEPSAEAFASCEDGEGFINVGITDDSSETYDVFIDEVLVGDDVTDSDGGFYVYGPYENGVYNVVVLWFPDGEFEILNTDVTVDCEAEPTTVPTEEPTTTAQAAAATQPRFTG